MRFVIVTLLIWCFVALGQADDSPPSVQHVPKYRAPVVHSAPPSSQREHKVMRREISDAVNIEEPIAVVVDEAAPIEDHNRERRSYGWGGYGGYGGYRGYGGYGGYGGWGHGGWGGRRYGGGWGGYNRGWGGYW